jgi:hypothetical protein
VEVLIPGKRSPAPHGVQGEARTEIQDFQAVLDSGACPGLDPGFAGMTTQVTFAGTSLYNEKKKGILKTRRREKNRYEHGKKTGGFFRLHMTLVLFQYRAY